MILLVSNMQDTYIYIYIMYDPKKAEKRFCIRNDAYNTEWSHPSHTRRLSLH